MADLEAVRERPVRIVDELVVLWANVDEPSPEAWRRGVFDRLTELEGMCAAGLVDPRGLDRIWDVVRDGYRDCDPFVTVLVSAQLASCYLVALDPDRAAQITEDCRAQLKGAAIDESRRGLLLVVLEQLSSLLGREDAAEEIGAENSFLAPGGVRDAFLAGLSSTDAVRDSRAASQRNLNLLAEIIDACDAEDPDSVVSLRGVLRGAQRPAELVAYGWYVLAANLRSPDERPERAAALQSALEFLGPVQNAQLGLLGEIQLLRAWHRFQDGDREGARAGYEESVSSFFALRDASADPTLRPGFGDQVSWADDLVRTGYEIEAGEVLFGAIAGLQAHGVADALRAPDELSRIRAGAPRVSIRERFAGAWQPSWVWPRQLANGLPDDTALLQVFRGYDADGLFVSQLLSSRGLTTKKAVLPRRFLDRMFPIGARSVVRMRGPDWTGFAASLLPDELLDGRLDVRRLVVAPNNGAAAVPFASLPTDLGRLNERFEIVTVPHLPLWSRLREVEGRFKSAIVVGCDIAKDPDIGVAGLADELRTLQRLGVAVTRVDSFADLASQLPGHDVLVLGTHGLVDSDENVLAFPDHEQVSAVEFASLPLPQLVIAAACWSGGLHATPSPFGLVPACLLGGTRALVVALWDADSTVLSRSLIRLYEGLAAGVPLTSAFRAAQTAVAGVSPLAVIAA